MPIKKRTFYGFKHKSTGELLRLSCRDEYHSGDSPNEFRLTDDAAFSVFEASSLEQLANILMEDTPSYNSSATLPGWGDAELEELVPVKVTLSEETEELVLPEVARVKTLQVRDVPLRVAALYAGASFDLVTDKPGLVFWLVELPDGETLDSAQRWVGGPVYGLDRCTKRHLYAAVATPDEYVPLTTGKGPCVLLLASGSY